MGNALRVFFPVACHKPTLVCSPIIHNAYVCVCVYQSPLTTLQITSRRRERKTRKIIRFVKNTTKYYTYKV